MYGARGAMFGSGGVSDMYEIGSKRPRMIDLNPYFAVPGGSSGVYQPYIYTGGSSSGIGIGIGSGAFSPSTFPVVRLRGLPFNCTDNDVFKFFAGLDIVDVLLTNKNGRFSGEAFVVFSTQIQADLALQRDRQNMGRRYIEVFRSKKQDYYVAISSEVSQDVIHERESPPPPPRSKRILSEKENTDFTETLKLRGLPYSVKKADILKFFGEFKVEKDKICIGSRSDGKPTGDAFVEFESVDDAKKAMCKDKMKIGSRYVELFPSTSDESKRAAARSRQ